MTTDALSRILTEAHRILAAPADGSLRTAAEWESAAQWAVDTDGDEIADLVLFIEEQEAFDNGYPQEPPELTRAQRNSMGQAAALEWEARGWL